MVCTKCGHEVVEGASFCPYCGEKMTAEADGNPIYTASVKGLLKSGELMVYRDRVEYVTSSVQKTVFNYSALVAVKKGLDRILFVTEDGRTEFCPVSLKKIHEAFLYIEQAVRPYLDERKQRLLSEGIQYSFVSSQGMTGGVLNISDRNIEFKSKTGQVEIVGFQDVRAVAAVSGSLELSLTNGQTKSFSLSKDLQDEVPAFVKNAVAPYIAERKEALRAQGIHHSIPCNCDGGSGTLDIRDDRADYTARLGQTESMFFQDIRAVRLYMGTLEIALTNGTFKSFLASQDLDDEEHEILAFLENAIQPYVTARTEGFDISFGVDERVEINETRGVFHIIRQGGNEITGEFPLESAAACEWKENRTADGMLGGVLSGGMALLNSAAKAVGTQGSPKAEDLVYSMDAVLTLRTEQGQQTETVRFGSFPLGMSRTNKKYERYTLEASAFLDYLSRVCPGCKCAAPPAPKPESQPLPALPTVPAAAAAAPVIPASAAPIVPAPAAPVDEDQFGITKYIEGVSGFINECTTPMTIAVQGSWGSGKNSIMNLLANHLEQNGNLLWFHTWQFSQFDLGEQLPMLVANRLIGQINGSNGLAAKDRAVKVAKGLISITSGFISQGGTDGQNLSEAIFRDNSADSLEKRVRTFSSLVEKRIGEAGGKIVIFIDDLDRLTSLKQVEMLEALRNFFDCDGCVFVVNVDYNSIISGAKERYGQDFDEQKGKSFFDKLFQVSFRVPVSGFNVQNYVKDKLEHLEIDSGGEVELGFYVDLIKHSVGGDPKSIDLLFNSFLLLKKLASQEMYGNKDQRLMLFALLCMQTAFHDIYDSLMQMKENVTPELLLGLCSSQSEVLAGLPLSDSERTEFFGFAKVFCDIINTDRVEEISDLECRTFAEVLDFSSITSK